MAETSGDWPIRTDKPNPFTPPLSSRDLISTLPDTVIHHIFSFLPLQDVVKTSVLSKRWRPTWTTATDLVFDGEIVARPCGTLDFSFIVDSVLIQCTSPTVKRFHITNFEYNEAHRLKFNLWLRFAEGHRVEELGLRLLPNTELPMFYILPRFLYCWSWLVRLEVWVCCFSLVRTIRWPCLKVLSILYSNLSDDILEEIFRGCPVLESLELWGCWDVKNIMIELTSVKELILEGLAFSNIQKIWAPHLLSLRMSGIWGPHTVFRLDDVSSLVEAKLKFSILPCDEKMHSSMLKEHFEKLREVTTMTIGVWCLQLELDEESKECFNYDGEDFLRSRKNFQCLAKHLKRVEITTDIHGLERLLPLIKFLLGETLSLEKMIIKADLGMEHGQEHLQAVDLSKLLGVSQNMLSYRRASKNAEVIFSHSFK
ncbi:hypothetical protein BT93_E2247 [Corymbia citriodora subsp. variegata]|nr:hypothetical protein BT93_E2247 [Corymbia citriodora subsp. variegata]